MSNEPSHPPGASHPDARAPHDPDGPGAAAGDGGSDARTVQRFRAVLRTLLAPAQGGLLLRLGPYEARLLLNSGVGVLVMHDTSRSQGELAAQLEDLISEQAARMRLVLVSNRPWAVPALKELKTRAPAGLAVFHIAPDGQVWTPSSLLFSDLRPALRAQAQAELLPRETPAAFFAAMEPVLHATAAQVGDVQEFAAALNARPVRVTYGLLALIGLLYALTESFGGPGRSGVLVRMGAEVPERIREGEWWRLLSATVLHGSIVHLLMNGLVLWNFGTFMERLLGWGRFLTVYVLAGLFGTVLGTLLSPLLQFGLSVGASGALFGLLGVSAVLAFRPSGLPELLQRDLKKSAIQNLLLNVIASLRPHIDWAAHLGGALVGGLLVLLGVARPQPIVVSGARPAPTRSDTVFSIVGALLGALLLACTALALYKGQPWLLKDPAAAHAVTLPEVGLTLDVPLVLGRPRPAEHTEGRLVFELGGDEAGQLVWLSVLPHDKELATPEQQQAEWAAHLEALRRFRPIEDARPVGEPQVFELAGYPTVEVRFLLPGGSEYRRLTQLRPRQWIVLEQKTPARMPDSLAVSLRRMLESSREAPAR
ncbi:MAG: rhomboid family intramembrane serine protease [Polyangia bacterium]